MRILLFNLVHIILINATQGQTPIEGEYAMHQLIRDTVSYVITLKLNCNGTYVRTLSDSSQTAYGKWRMKNNDLILSGDSVIIDHTTKSVNYKIVYENIENKFHLKSVPRKDYDDLIEAGRAMFPNLQGTKRGYEEYAKREKALYYEKIQAYSCK